MNKQDKQTIKTQVKLDIYLFLWYCLGQDKFMKMAYSTLEFCPRYDLPYEILKLCILKPLQISVEKSPYICRRTYLNITLVFKVNL